MTLPHFDWKRAAIGGLLGAMLVYDAFLSWYGKDSYAWDGHLWIPNVIWAAGGVSVLIGGFMGEEVWDLPERFGDWLWKQFFGSSM